MAEQTEYRKKIQRQREIVNKQKKNENTETKKKEKRKRHREKRKEECKWQNKQNTERKYRGKEKL